MVSVSYGPTTDLPLHVAIYNTSRHSFIAVCLALLLSRQVREPSKQASPNMLSSQYMVAGSWLILTFFFFFLGYARPKLNGQIEPSLLLPRPMNQTMAMDPLFSSSIFLLKTRGPIVSPSQQIKEHSSSECSNNFSCLISFLPSSNGTQGKAKLG